MPTDSSAGHRPPGPPPEVPAAPDLPRLVNWAKLVTDYLHRLGQFSAGVPGGWKETDPNPTGTASDPGTLNAGWMAADATVKQGIVTTKGDVLTHSTVPARLGVGSNTQVLLADSAEGTGLRWASQSELSQAGGGWARHFLLSEGEDWPLAAPDGSAAAPSYSFAGAANAGMYAVGSAVALKANDASGTDQAGGLFAVDAGRGTGLGAAGDFLARIAPSGSISGSSLNALQNFIKVQNSGLVDIGNLNLLAAGTPGTMTIRSTGTNQLLTDFSSADLELQTGTSTGLGTGGSIFARVTPPGSATGTAPNARQIGLSISGTDGATTIGGLDIFGTPGASTWAGADRAAGVTDGSGGDVTIRGGQPTGTGPAGTITHQLAPPAATTGTAQAALRNVEAWSVGSLADPQTTDITMTADNGGTMVRKSFSELLTLSTVGATTDTTANLLPAGAIILSVTTRVTTTISGGGVTAFSVGDPTTSARFSASAGGLTAGSLRTGLQHQQGSVATDAAGPVQTSAAKVRITCDATPTAGVVRIQVWVVVFTPPSS